MRNIIILLAALVSSLGLMAAPTQMEIPKDRWVSLYFKSIDSFSSKIGWGSLRQMDIRNGSIEIRIWIGFGLKYLEGVRIKNDGGRWISFYAKDGPKKFLADKQVSVPLSEGWLVDWSELQSLGILSLPDSSTLKGGAIVKDGVSYVFEINEGGRYRTYNYDSPKYQNWPEAKNVIGIHEILISRIISKAQ